MLGSPIARWVAKVLLLVGRKLLLSPMLPWASAGVAAATNTAAISIDPAPIAVIVVLRMGDLLAASGWCRSAPALVALRSLQPVAGRGSGYLVLLGDLPAPPI